MTLANEHEALAQQLNAMVHVKILSYKSPQRYAVRQTIAAAQRLLQKQHPQLDITISEVKTLEEIEQYTSVFILPSLVVNEKLVCVGRFPKKEEVVAWLEQASLH